MGHLCVFALWAWGDGAVVCGSGACAKRAHFKCVRRQVTKHLTFLRLHLSLPTLIQRSQQYYLQVNKMRIDMIRSSLAAPESMMRILSDYPMVPDAPPPPSMLDIALDLPEPAAVQRRAVQARGGGVLCLIASSAQHLLVVLRWAAVCVVAWFAAFCRKSF